MLFFAYSLFPKQCCLIYCKSRLKQARPVSLPLIFTSKISKAMVQHCNGLSWSWPLSPSPSWLSTPGLKAFGGGCWAAGTLSKSLAYSVLTLCSDKPMAALGGQLSAEWGWVLRDILAGFRRDLVTHIPPPHIVAGLWKRKGILLTCLSLVSTVTLPPVLSLISTSM